MLAENTKLPESLWLLITDSWVIIYPNSKEGGVTNCSFSDPRVAGSFLGRTVNRVVWEARLYSGEYRRIIAVRIAVGRLLYNKVSV